MIKYVNYKNFGKCLYYKNDQIHLMVTIDVGPRIIFLGKDLKNNILFEDVRRNFQMKSPAFKKIFGKNALWDAYGGHRIWTTPETLYTYEPDDKKVNVKVINDHTFEFITSIAKVSGLQFILKIAINKNTVLLTHTIINHSKKIKSLAPWIITSFAPNGMATFKMNDINTGFLPNRSLALWPYTSLSDKRLSIKDKDVSIKMDPKIKCPFKIGSNLTNVSASYLLNKTKLTIQSKNNHVGNYPDFGSALEVYTNQHFLEIEVMGKIVDLKPHQKTSVVEKWILDKK